MFEPVSVSKPEVLWFLILPLTKEKNRHLLHVFYLSECFVMSSFKISKFKTNVQVFD
jgi:hypothetical protein